MSRADEFYKPALRGKQIPILTLDNKWHRLFTQIEPNRQIKKKEEEVNELVKRQGKLTTECKNLKRLKKTLMDEIVSYADELEQNKNSILEQKMEDNKRLINECNDKLDGYQDELLDLPQKLNEANYQLMLLTMEVCYSRLRENTTEIQEAAEWVAQIRVELKKRLIRKQEKEIMNNELYTYMHNIFGAEVIEIFDMKYTPEAKKPSLIPETRQAENKVKVTEAAGQVKKPDQPAEEKSGQ